MRGANAVHGSDTRAARCEPGRDSPSEISVVRIPTDGIPVPIDPQTRPIRHEGVARP